MPVKRKSATGSKASVLPKELPTDPEIFWRSPAPASCLPPEGVDRVPALQRLGPLPFSGSGFPLMGFLATLFEHVSTSAGEALKEGHKTAE